MVAFLPLAACPRPERNDPRILRRPGLRAWYLRVAMRRRAIFEALLIPIPSMPKFNPDTATSIYPPFLYSSSPVNDRMRP